MMMMIIDDVVFVVVGDDGDGDGINDDEFGTGDCGNTHQARTQRILLLKRPSLIHFGYP